MSLAPLELISALAWERVTFTTYALSLSFFEAILLDALVRAGGREALILTDVEGIRMALGEQGARRVGRDYDVEPIAVRTGVFHPKISVLKSGRECHVLIGSGNLTFGGWGGNLEAVEHLHAGFAADAIEDVADFFERLASAENARHNAAERCRLIAGDLRNSVQDRPRNRDIRVFHSLDGAISRKLIQVIQDLGGAIRLVAASPFWDGGAAIDELCSAVGLSEVFVHAHVGGTVEGAVGSNWPAAASIDVRPVRLEVMNEDRPRRLHAKVFEVTCKQGRVLVSGSANATIAALGERGNLEACVVRIQREPISSWTFTACEAPPLLAALDDQSSDHLDVPGVLRASLEGERIIGEVLTPKMSGTVSVCHLTNEGAKELGNVTLGSEGKFSLDAPELEPESWTYGRLVLEVRSADGRRAEGFVSIAAFAAVTRRAGAIAPRLFSLLAGTETPADVAAIMSWFHEDPERLSSASLLSISGHANKEHSSPNDGLIAVSALSASNAVTGERSGEAGNSASWRRFMENIFAAFRERRGPFEDENEDDDGSADGARAAPKSKAKQPERRKPDPAITRSLEVFQKLFNLLLSPENVQRHGITAFDLTQYVCERLQPDREHAAGWLKHLIESLSRAAPTADRCDDVAASVLVWLASSPQPDRARTARSWLMRLGYPLTGGAPSSNQAQGFQSVLIPMIGFAEAWSEVTRVRTFSEQVRAYLSALKTGQATTEYADLQHAAPEEWPILRDALSCSEVRDRILVLNGWSDACPRHHIVLPSIERSKLQTVGIATAKNCCHRILLYPGR